MSNIDKIARVAYEAVRAWKFSCDVYSPSWDALHSTLADKWRAEIAYRCLNLDTAPQSNHDRWRTAQEAEGWKYGPEFDEDQRTDPRMRNFHEIPFTAKMEEIIRTHIVGTVAGPLMLQWMRALVNFGRTFKGVEIKDDFESSLEWMTYFAQDMSPAEAYEARYSQA